MRIFQANKPSVLGVIEDKLVDPVDFSHDQYMELLRALMKQDRLYVLVRIDGEEPRVTDFVLGVEEQTCVSILQAWSEGEVVDEGLTMALLAWVENLGKTKLRIALREGESSSKLALRWNLITMVAEAQIGG